MSNGNDGPAGPANENLYATEPAPQPGTLNERIVGLKARWLTDNLIQHIDIVCDDPGEVNAVIDHAIEMLETGRPKPEDETTGTPESTAAFKARLLMGPSIHHIDI